MRTIPCPKCRGKGRLPDPREVAAEFRAMRQDLGVSLREVARRMGISPMYLSDMETAQRSFTDEMKLKFMDAMNKERVK